MYVLICWIKLLTLHGLGELLFVLLRAPKAEFGKQWLRADAVIHALATLIDT